MTDIRQLVTPLEDGRLFIAKEVAEDMDGPAIERMLAHLKPVGWFFDYLRQGWVFDPEAP